MEAESQAVLNTLTENMASRIYFKWVYFEGNGGQ
jgi:hypothetical protein